MTKTFPVNVNGQNLQVEAEPGASLLGFLRNDLKLPGSKYGCGEAQCGACTVLIDGESRRSCVTRLEQVAGKKVVTIEGLEHDGHLHPLQEAFLKTEAFQCGYCTSGMIMSGVALLSKNPNPNRDETVHHMNGNVCRCGTYLRILDAIDMASGKKHEVSK